MIQVSDAPRTYPRSMEPDAGSILPLRLAGVSYDAGGKRLLHDFDAEFESGSRTILLGPNGAGKSITLRLCHGLIRPSAGSVRWLGPGAGEAAKRQAMVFQRPIMLRRSAAANIHYALALHGVPRRLRRDRVAQVLEKTGLKRFAGTPARVLSAGEQQRLALARAWALEPQTLFLDEPTANLDPTATRAVEGIIQAVHESGTKIIMTTHDMGQARRLADEVLFLHEGRLIERSPAQRFFERPESTAALAFIEGRLWFDGGEGDRTP